MNNELVLIVRREFLTRLRSKMFTISTGLLVVAVVGFVILTNALSGRSTASDVGLLPDAASLSAPLTATAGAVGLEVKPREVATRESGETQLRDGSLDALVVRVSDGRSGGPTSVEVLVKRDGDSQLKAALTVLARQIAQDSAVSAGGGDPAAVNQAVAKAGVQVVSLDHTPAYQNERIVLGIMAGILVYLALMIYGQAVAQGVIEEKTSRVVELLLATVRPWQMMLGKVLGIGAVGLLQMVLVTGAGLAAALASGVLTMPRSIAFSAVVWTVVWFLVGFVMYALLFAAAGALVSRQEDAGGVTAPIITLIVIPYIVAISVLPAQPDNGVARILSLVPFFSPTIMPVRIALGSALWWEVAVSVVLSLLLTAALVALAGRVYQNSVMRSGARVRLADALRPL